MRALVIAMILASASSAHAGWRVCNRTPEVLWVSVAWDRGGGYTSRGWYKLLPCGGCATVLSDKPHTTAAFVHAHRTGETANALANNARFCTKARDAFTFSPRANTNRAICESNGGQLRDYSQFNVTSDDHTSTITGRGTNGRVCID